MNRTIELAGRRIGEGCKPLIVAGLFGNQKGLLERVDSAADAFKLHSFLPERLTLDSAWEKFHISNPDNLWRGKALYELYCRTQTPRAWHAPIFERCRQRGL